MADSAIRRRLDAIIALQVLLIVLSLPGGRGMALTLGLLFGAVLLVRALLVLERSS